MTNKTLLITSLLITVFATHPASAVSVSLLDIGFGGCGTGQVVFEDEKKEGEKEGEENPEEECE